MALSLANQEEQVGLDDVVLNDVLLGGMCFGVFVSGGNFGGINQKFG